MKIQAIVNQINKVASSYPTAFNLYEEPLNRLAMSIHSVVRKEVEELKNKLETEDLRTQEAKATARVAEAELARYRMRFNTLYNAAEDEARFHDEDCECSLCLTLVTFPKED